MGNKTPGLCCKPSPLQEAIPKEEVGEIENIMERKAITWVHLCPKHFYEPVLLQTRARVGSSLRVRKHPTYSSTKSYQKHQYTCMGLSPWRALWSEKSHKRALLHLHTCTDRYPSIHITVLFGFTHSCASLNIIMQLKSAAASLRWYKRINALVNFPHPSLPVPSLIAAMSGDNNHWLELLVGPLGVSTAMKVKAWPGVSKQRGELVGQGMDGDVCFASTALRASGWSQGDLCGHKHPVVQPYLWVAEGVLWGAQVVPCVPGLVSCLHRNPVPGAFLKGDIVVLRCAPPQSCLRAGLLRPALWALHSSAPPHAHL